MAVDSFQLYGDIPSFNLDGYRYAVLKLLYTLVSCSEFGGDASVRRYHPRITLVIFLRVLNSTSPRPRFLPEDWCTPTLTASFVPIAFQDDAWASRYEPGHGYISRLPTATELVHYFLQFPPVMNEFFSHFVSRRLLSPIVGLRGPSLASLAWDGFSMILNAFITGLESNVLDAETIQRPIDYLVEPDNLFTVCAVLLIQNARSALRRLALLRRDDPVWPGCLMQLDTIPMQLPTIPMHLKSQLRPIGPYIIPESISEFISEFRTFVEGGCVGVYGIDMDDSQAKRRDHNESSRPESWPSRIKSWLNQLWSYRDNEEEVARFSGDGQV
ncbi:hypothetical protein IW262DRAFT_202078 [Armillaria fumosa]|nr:hypothetical protein IW262DRAFT_202078 [Armillaria fumosa]